MTGLKHMIYYIWGNQANIWGNGVCGYVEYFKHSTCYNKCVCLLKKSLRILLLLSIEVNCVFSVSWPIVGQDANS